MNEGHAADLGPRDLSVRLIGAYNRRDIEALMSLVADSVEYIRPGPIVMTSREEVRRQYLEDWELLEESLAEMRHAYVAGSTVAAEITLHVRRGDQRQTVEAAVFHQWLEQKLVRYRAYFDIPPPQPTR